MKAAGYRCEVHDDYFKQDAPDEEWIEFASQRNWVILTRDNSARHRRTFLSYVQIYSSRVFIARMRNAHSDYILHSLVKGKNKIEKFLELNAPPFIAGIQSNGDINKYELPNISI